MVPRVGGSNPLLPPIKKNLPQTRICEAADFFMFFAGTLSDKFYDAQKAANFFDVFVTAIVFLCDFATVALTLFPSGPVLYSKYG